MKMRVKQQPSFILFVFQHSHRNSAFSMLYSREYTDSLLVLDFPKMNVITNKTWDTALESSEKATVFTSFQNCEQTENLQSLKSICKNNL